MLYKSKGEKIADAVLPLVDGQASPPRVGGGFKSEGAPAAAAAAEAALGSAAAAAAPGLTQNRTLRTKLSQHSKQPHLIVISSPESGDGKSVTAINTAGALALKSEGQVLLLDADLRKATIHMQLGLPQSPGLADVLAGACTPEEALVRTKELPNLYVVSSGTPPANPVELLDSARWRTLCAELRDVFRYVIIDSPPVGTVADYELIQAVCDGVILVMRPDFTNRHLCKCALDFVPNAKFLGVVLNCVPDWSPGKYTGSNYYYYSSSPENAYRK